MFWDKFTDLCIKANKSPTAVVMELGISPASVTQWKNGSTPRSKTVYKIADYFGINPEELSGFESSTFYGNLCYLCAKTDETPNSVAQSIGMTSAAVTGWIAGRVPRDTAIKKIADHFGITTDELLSDDISATKKTAIPEDSGLSADEVELIQLIRVLSPEEQDRELAYLRELSQRHEGEKER